MNGWVMDAGGGYLSILVRRDTERYLRVGTRVVVIPAEQHEAAHNDGLEDQSQ